MGRDNGNIVCAIATSTITSSYQWKLFFVTGLVIPENLLSEKRESFSSTLIWDVENELLHPVEVRQY